ncbi:Lrp/AsnC family transcriptional regulator [Bacillus sp. OR-18]|uniref:Lrp/AsnC family transcriptional regulator n=1 Tax=Bacillus sp. OR-18 TaxID=3029191 RepID=UPI00259E2DEF|nr:Lrp/AsnC family transcriptional regulator [Bacillus sp. OR-18]
MNIYRSFLCIFYYIDTKMLNLLKENSRVQWRDIGKEIHMTGQAVGNRVRKLEEEGIIRVFTILLDEMKLGKSHLAFITIFMKTNEHSGILDFIVTKDSVVEAHKISGESCYILKVFLESYYQYIQD